MPSNVTNTLPVAVVVTVISPETQTVPEVAPIVVPRQTTKEEVQGVIGVFRTPDTDRPSLCITKATLVSISSAMVAMNGVVAPDAVVPTEVILPTKA